jgi:hypothetical protein
MRFRPILCFLIAALSLTGGVAGAPDQPVDLTRQPWFPPVTRQQSFSCSQQVALYYLFTGEWNRSLERSSAAAGQRFSPYFAYSQLAGDVTGRTHVVDGWIVAQQAGVPAEPDCPVFSRTLMNGYDRYLRAMRHRVKSWEILPVTTDAGIARAKNLLTAGHLLACDFQIKGTVLKPLLTGAHAKEKFVFQWGRTGAGHAMVYAGFDDNVGFDFNGDGKITNDLDINGDGVVSLADRERGAFLLINPWGGGWGDRGRAWVPYRQHALSRWPWSGSVARVEAAAPYQPRLTLKLKMRVSDRQNVIVTAGNAKGRSMQTWMFSHAPASGAGSGSLWDSFTSLRARGPHLSPGALATADGGALETGHDLTALGTAAGYTLEVRTAGRGALAGELTAASFMEYDSSGRLVREVPVAGLPGKLPAAGGLWHAP